MTFPKKPAKGDSAIPIITDAELWGALIDIANAWKEGKLKPTSAPGANTAHQVTPVLWNQTGDPLTDIVQRMSSFADPTGVSDDKATHNLAFAKPTWGTLYNGLQAWPEVKLGSPIAGLTTLLRRDIARGDSDSTRSGRYATVDPGEDVNCEFRPYVAPALVDDNGDPVSDKLQATYSGDWRVLSQFDSGEVVLDTQDSQRIYTFRLDLERWDEENENSSTGFRAHLMDIFGFDMQVKSYRDEAIGWESTGELKQNEVWINDIHGFCNNMQVGDIGTCKMVGEKLFAIDTHTLHTTFIKFTLVDWDSYDTGNKGFANIDVITDRVKTLESGSVEPEFYKAGDGVFIYDVDNQFPDARGGATGVAMWVIREGQTPEDPLVKQWEMVTCTLPVQEMEIYSIGCVYKTDESSWHGFFEYNLQSDTSTFNRGNGTNVDPPNDVQITTTEGPNILRLEFQNTFGLDCISGSKIRVRRVTNKAFSGSIRSSAFANGQYWEAVSVSDQIARWICAQWTGDTWALYGPNPYWQGGDPTTCNLDPLVVKGCLDVDLDCVVPGSVFVCCWDPERENYRIVSSISGVLGDPIEKLVPSGEPKVDLSQCEDGNYCWEWPATNIKTWSCDDFEAAGDDPPDPPVIEQCLNGKEFLNCIDVCAYIECYCDPYSVEEPNPECPCEEFCVWEWDGLDWILVENNCEPAFCECAEPPSPLDGEFFEPGDQLSKPCVAVTEICPNCVECEPDKQVDIAVLSWDDVETDATVAAPGAECLQLGGGQKMRVSYAKSGDAVKNGDCIWRVPIQWKGTQDSSGCVVDPFDSVATVTYDGGVWRVVPDDSSPWSPNNGIFEGPGDCTGLVCNAGGAVCDMGSDPDGTRSAVIGTEVKDCPALSSPPMASSSSVVMIDNLAGLGETVSLGTHFHDRNPELFKGCGCTKDVIAILNRSGVDLRDDTRKKVVRLLRRKNKSITEASIDLLLTEAIETYEN